MKRVALLQRTRQLWWGCAAVYAVLHVIGLVLVGGQVGVMLAFLLLFDVARNAAHLYRRGSTWFDLQAGLLPLPVLYFLPAPPAPGRPAGWPGIRGMVWLGLGALIGWNAGGPSLTDPLVQYGHVLLATGLAGMGLGATYGALVGRFEVYTLEGQTGPTGKVRGSFHATVFLMMFFIQMNFVHPDLQVFVGHFGHAWNAHTEGGSHEVVRGTTPAEGLLAIHFGATPGQITFSELLSAPLAQPLRGVQLQYQWQGDETPDLWLVFTGIGTPAHRSAQPRGAPLPSAALAPGTAQEGWQETFVPVDRTVFRSVLLTGILLEKRSASAAGVLHIKAVRLVRTKDSVAMPAVAPQMAVREADRSSQDDRPGTSPPRQPMPSIPQAGTGWRSLRGWLVPGLLIVWGFGYRLGAASARSKWRDRQAFQHADLWAVLSNTIFVLGLVGILTGNTWGAPHVAAIVAIFLMAYSGGSSLAYWWQRLRETQPPAL